MTLEVRRAHDESVPDEVRERMQLVAQLEQHRRAALAFDCLAEGAFSSARSLELWSRLLELFVEVAQADVAVLRLKDGENLRSMAAIGLEDEVKAGFTHPIDLTHNGRAWAGEPPIRQVKYDEPLRSQAMSAKGVRGLCAVPLMRESLLGVLYLGFKVDRPLTEAERGLLSSLAARAAHAIEHQQRVDGLHVAVRARDDVMAVVAHDLQNPLNVISIAANSLLRRMADSTARRPIERVLKATTRATRLVRDLLEVQAIEAGRLALERRPIEPAELLLSCLESQQNLAAEASVIISSDVTPSAPLIEADEERLMEVLENLIGNAVKFTQAGGSVVVGAAPHEEGLLVWVKDTGAGIAPAELPHIFDRFWHTKKRDRRGTGLGLAICRGIVEAHGGRIWAQSEVGAGTTVSFIIPATTRKPQDEKVEKANILLVDDRPENLLSLSAILDRPDYALFTAQSGEEALRLVLREQFVVALIDVSMPRMNGLEVATHLKELERTRNIPIIFITAFGDDPEEIHRAYSAGGADYLVKPLDTEIVRKKVAVFVDLSRRRRETT